MAPEQVEERAAAERATVYEAPPDGLAAVAPREAHAAGACASCGAALHGRYCHACGERVVGRDDLRVRRFVAESLHGAFDIDSRLWRTLRLLVLRPGELTAEHMRGRRRPYLGPLQLFLIVNVAFFTVLATAGGFNTFTTSLYNHMRAEGYGAVASELVERRAPADTPERDEYVRRFDDATPRYANSLVIVMVPIFALLLAALHGRGRYFVHHLVFSLHFYAWLLLLLIAVPLSMRALFFLLQLTLDAGTVMVLFEVLDNDETIIGVALLSAFTWYLVRALQRAYQARLGAALLRGTVMAAAVMPVLILYRMILFFVVYYRQP